MTIDIKISKIYPSASAFMQGNGVIADYNNACPRFIVASIGTKKVDIDPIYEALGAHHEEWYAAQIAPILLHREFVIQEMIKDAIQYSGRADFVTTTNEVHETKASLSKNFLYKVVRKGEVKLSHLAQTVSYMIKLGFTTGKIIAGFYKAFPSTTNKYTFYLQEHRIFHITIENDGRIFIDGVYSKFDVADQLRHLYLVATALEDTQIRARPVNYAEWGGPCMFCPLKALCTTFDTAFITEEEFKAQGSELINAQELKPYKMQEKSNGRKGITGYSKLNKKGV